MADFTKLNGYNVKDDRVGDLNSLTTTQTSSIVGAINEVNQTANNTMALLNMSEFESYSGQDITTSNVTDTNVILYTASNSNGSIGKIYGVGYVTSTDNSSEVVLTIQTSFRPESDFTIVGGVVALGEDDGQVGYIEVKTTGEVDIVINALQSTTFDLSVIPCLYFIKDFGDTEP